MSESPLPHWSPPFFGMGYLKKVKFWQESKYENIISNFISVPAFGMISRVIPEAFTKF
ncbi:MAG TPA: hypothetical protein VEL11_06465 [Candidatus Bathyarchaeia archaeon]|nr:hypothetical protein [Candidatus Bathyarchaeia archaeon]